MLLLPCTAVRELNGKELMGKTLSVEISKGGRGGGAAGGRRRSPPRGTLFVVALL
jgi:RNA recognition motif-containing protein